MAVTLRSLKRIALALMAATTLATALARAESARAEMEEPRPPEPWESKMPHIVLLASGAIGTGLRFNDPYRLPSPLGNTAETISRSSIYADIGFSAVFGRAMKGHHGASLQCSFALEGVSQAVLVPSYAYYRRWPEFALTVRAGPAVVVSPKATWGMQAAVGGTYFILGGIGVTAEAVGDLFYGTGTRDVPSAAYPMLSAQVGLTFAYEVMP